MSGAGAKRRSGAGRGVRLWLAIVLCLLAGAPGALALEEATAQIAAARAAGDVAGEVDALLARAQIWQRLGRHGDALDDFDTARPLAQGLEDPARLATLGAGLGTSHLALRQPAAARAALEASLAQAEAAGLVAHQAATLNTLGNLLAEEEREAALAALADSARLARTAGEPAIASAALLEDDPAAARAYLGEARGLLATAPGSPDKAFQLLALGRALAALGAAGEAEAVYREGGELAEAAGDRRLLSYARGYEGQLREQAGEIAAALAPPAAPCSSPRRRARPRSSTSGSGSSAACWRPPASRTLRLPPTTTPSPPSPASAPTS